MKVSTFMEFIVHLPAILAGVAAIITAWRVGRKVDAVHQLANSRLDELVQATSAGARAEGRLEGAETERNTPPRG